MTAPTDRIAILRDGAYFARELRRCIEQLEDVERDGRLQANWQQAAAIIGRIGRLLREQAAKQQAARNARDRAQRLRQAQP